MRRRIIGSALLVAGLLLGSMLLALAAPHAVESAPAPQSNPGMESLIAQAITLDPAAEKRIADYRAHPERAGEIVPPMYIEPYSGPLKPRQITPKDFYLNLVDVSNQNGIVVKFTEDAMIRWRDGKPYSKRGVSVQPILDFLTRHPGIVMDRNDPVHPEELFDYWEANGEKNTGQDLANLNNFYEFFVPENPDPMGLIREVLEWDIVETAWYVPKWELACTDVPPVTPDWEANQDYLDPAPLGVDAQYAWAYHPTYGRGRAGYWCIDIEGSWTEGHEDLPTSFSILEGGDGGWLGDHGDAVVGIIAACNNDYGITGISSNVDPKAISWPWQTGATDQDRWITAFNAADGWLFPGESYMIEIHYFGPDPGYGCDTVCGNCGQFRYIAVEYWDNVFTAIQTHTANGTLVYEAAGNGQMNLDNAVYGNRFQRWFRDSGAMLIGAGIPNTRVGECWSNYGSRCDLQGWGSGVYTLGYGWLWAGTVAPDRTQWYTNGFGGTSSATPIVTGSGNVLQAISQGKYGITLTPSQMRDYLSITGTAWAGTHNVGERPNLASAINYIEPDVTYYLPAGWSYPFTPRNTTGATSDNCLITPLDGNTNNTYYNFRGINSGRSPAPDCTGTVVGGLIELDGAGITGYSTGRLSPNQQYSATNWGPVTVRGGRHSWRFTGDDQNLFNEYSETNNAYTNQFVWSPLIMTPEIVYTRSVPPLKSWGSPAYVNGDGFRANGGWWLGVAVLPEVGTDDVDLYSYASAYSSTTGFDSYIRRSQYGSGSPDFVLVNGNQVGHNPTRNYQAIRYDDTDAGNFRIESDTSRPAWSTPYANTDYLPSTEIFDMYELYMVNGSQYFIGVTDVDAGLDLKLTIYSPDSSEMAYSGYKFYRNDRGAGGSEYVIWTCDRTGYYAAVAMKNSYLGYGVGGWYTFRFESPGTPNLAVQPLSAGWEAPLVVRHSNDAATNNALFPAALQHDAFCYFNSAWLNKGTAVCPAGYDAQIVIDGQGLFDLIGGQLNPYFYYMDINDGPWAGIRGGRHTISLTVDLGNSVAESSEGDNAHSAQYVWSPLPLTHGVGLGRFGPPLKGTGAYYNNDGFSFNPAAFYGSAVGVLPNGLAADYDMYVYSDYAGTYSGYSNLIGYSPFGSCAVDYVIVPYRLESTYDTYYPAAINYNGATDAMYVEAKHTAGRVSFGSTLSFSDSLMNDNILNPYEFYMEGGSSYLFELDILSGSAYLELRVFRDSLTVLGRPSAVAVGYSGSILTYTPPVSDWYMIVVARYDCNSSGMPVWYQINVGPNTPPPVTDLTADYWPSPAGIRLAWSPISFPYGFRYIIYRNSVPDFTPTIADSIGWTTDTTYIDVNPFAATKNFYCVQVRPN